MDIFLTETEIKEVFLMLFIGGSGVMSDENHIDSGQSTKQSLKL